jgi:hypothetical protein
VILGRSNCNLTSTFGVIAQIWLALSLDRCKWYQNNLVTPCGNEALHGMGLGEDVKDSSWGGTSKS